MNVGAAVAALLLTVCPPIPESPSDACPQVYHVEGELPPEDGLNLLFVSHGFLEEELNEYRCAVRLLFEKLTKIKPYSRAAPAINVYRIDLAIGDGMMNLVPVCNGTECPYSDTYWKPEAFEKDCKPEIAGDIGTPTLGEDEIVGDCMLFDPDVSACPGGNSSCRVSWPSEKGFDQLWRLSNCAPNVHAIVVLTDNGQKSGGGSDSMSPKMIVSTMLGIDAENTRGNLLAHELAHAFGLLDEYPSGAVEVDGQLPDYHAGRNVFSTAEDDTVPPWKYLCSESQADLQFIEGCGVVPDQTNIEGAPTIGLYQGAFYQTQQFYRAQGACRMKNLSTKTFCAGCVHYLDGLMDDLGFPGEP